MSAPAATMRGAVRDVDPAVHFDRRRAARRAGAASRTARTLDSDRGMKVWPPNPGLTVITST